jgi:hypothetical protein
MEMDIPHKRKPRQDRSAIVILDKTDFKTVTTDKERFHIMMKGSILEEYITIYIYIYI